MEEIKMKNRALPIMIFFLTTAFSTVVYCQPGGITLSFTAINNTQPVQLDSVYIKNITQNCDTVLYPPDLVLVLDTLETGINEIQSPETGFQVIQNYPNPFIRETFLSIIAPGNGTVKINVFNSLGKELISQSFKIEAGKTGFAFNSGSDVLYLLSATFQDETKVIKMISNQIQEGNASITMIGSEKSEYYKSMDNVFGMYFEYEPGDQLIYVAHVADEESGITDIPDMNRNYEFQFATNIPCPGMDSIFYEGQYYHTIQIYSQCWMKENLNAGTMINAHIPQADNGIIEKYCYGNNPANCTLYGGMYYWDELMSYSTVPGTQGICPEGWHIATDEEWKILEGVADSFYPIAHNIWNTTNFRGLDAGYNLKSTSGWPSKENGPDLYGFKALPTGYWWEGGFSDINEGGSSWTSVRNAALLPYYRGIHFQAPAIARNTFPGIFAFAVRCLKNV